MFLTVFQPLAAVLTRLAILLSLLHLSCKWFWRVAHGQMVITANSDHKACVGMQGRAHDYA